MRASPDLALRLLALLPVVFGGQECYVCLSGDDSLQLQRQFPGEDLPVCGRGEDAVKTCPPTYHGCLTQYSGDKVMRSCGELNLTVCQKANGVEYCYCRGNLCNGEEGGGGGERSSQEGGGGRPPPDDEDLPGEGSGAAPAQAPVPAGATPASGAGAGAGSPGGSSRPAGSGSPSPRSPLGGASAAAAPRWAPSVPLALLLALGSLARGRGRS